MDKNKLLIIFFVGLFIFIRSINFTKHLNFSYDQAWFSTRVLEIWKNKEFTLVGPGSSIVVNGKQVLYGSINYYYQLIFQLLGSFDPVYSSYAFMLFAAIMIIPLYFGIKLLANEKIALLSIALYSLAPIYIDFTRFFFAPNFQISLTPLAFLFMGLHKKTANIFYFFLTFLLVGILMQFHFAILLLFFLLTAYYFRDKSERSLVKLFIALFAFVIGLSPLIIFELKNKFYNLRVFSEYLQNTRNASNFEPLPHRYLVLSFFLTVFLLIKFRKFITYKVILASLIILLGIDFFIYLPVPKNGFGMSKHWNYPLEKKAYEIIKKQNIKDYNVANLIYDNKAVVIKYLMKKDGININFDDYYRNNYLFVIAETYKQISENSAYEITTFSPREKIREWKLNNSYNLYLFKRIK